MNNAKAHGNEASRKTTALQNSSPKTILLELKKFRHREGIRGIRRVYLRKERFSKGYAADQDHLMRFNHASRFRVGAHTNVLCLSGYMWTSGHVVTQLKEALSVASTTNSGALVWLLRSRTKPSVFRGQ